MSKILNNIVKEGWLPCGHSKFGEVRSTLCKDGRPTSANFTHRMLYKTL